MQVLVLLKVDFKRIIEVDTVNESFAADVYLRARWEEPALIGISQQVRYRWTSMICNSASEFHPVITIEVSSKVSLELSAFVFRRPRFVNCIRTQEMF